LRRLVALSCPRVSVYLIIVSVSLIIVSVYLIIVSVYLMSHVLLTNQSA